MTEESPSRTGRGNTDDSGRFQIRRIWHFLMLFILFLISAVWLSVRIMKVELQTATNRLVGHSAGASRNLETQFDSLRDDFRVLVSTGAFDAYATESPNLESRDYAMVKRFFARYQEMITSIEIELSKGETVRIALAPGNYLRTTRQPSPEDDGEPTAPSYVTHNGDSLVIGEIVPPGEGSSIHRVRLIIDHNRFFADRLASYLMGQTDLWIWSIDEQSTPTLIRSHSRLGHNGFGVDPDAIGRIRATLDRGLEGVEEHEIKVPTARSVISVFTPLLLGEERMGLVFSTDRETHLESLHRLSTFLWLIFLGSLVLLAAWFAVSYNRIRESEREQAAARERAEAADRAKSEFVAAMSHEIRTPLNGVLGYADLLMGSRLSSEQRDYVEVIRNSGDHLLSILNDILDFSKISSGNMTMRWQEYSPVECADDVIDMMSTAAQDQGLELRLEVDGVIPDHVMGDPGRLRQVLYNLTGNGIKFTHKGGVRILMRALDEGDRWKLEFVVSDTGIGIPEDKRGHLFAPFSQIDSSSARKYEGAGLGLAICSRLVEKMGGEIGFESQDGVGSDFHFWIKAGKADANAKDGYTRALEGRTVLVIDHTAQFLETLAGRLRRMGARVLCASDEQAAVRVIPDEVKVDLVMIDWTGDPETGRAIAARLSRSPGPAASLIALTSPKIGEDPPSGIFRERINKPVRLASLARLLSKAMSDAPVPEPPAEVETLQVLVAEDNMINSELMVALLNSRGASTTVASNGLEALAELEMREFDLVFMDVEMPGLDGLEVTRRIRKNESSGHRHTWIAGLSAHAFHEDRSLAIHAGMDDYLTKPVDLADLDRVLKEGIERKRILKSAATGKPAAGKV